MIFPDKSGIILWSNITTAAIIKQNAEIIIIGWNLPESISNPKNHLLKSPRLTIKVILSETHTVR